MKKVTKLIYNQATIEQMAAAVAVSIDSVVEEIDHGSVDAEYTERLQEDKELLTKLYKLLHQLASGRKLEITVE